jgi:hypothetical protein
MSAPIVLADDCWIYAFQTNQNCLILASPKEITEVDVSMMLASDPLAWLEESGHRSNHSSSRVRKGHAMNS